MQETLSQNRFNQVKKLKRTSTLGIILLKLILLLSTVSISKNLDWFNHFRQGYGEYPQYVSISVSLWRPVPSYWFTSAQGLPGNFRPQPSQWVSGWALTDSLFSNHEREHHYLKRRGIHCFPCENWQLFTRWEVARDSVIALALHGGVGASAASTRLDLFLCSGNTEGCQELITAKGKWLLGMQWGKEKLLGFPPPLVHPYVVSHELDWVQCLNRARCNNP